MALNRKIFTAAVGHITQDAGSATGVEY